MQPAPPCKPIRNNRLAVKGNHVVTSTAEVSMSRLLHGRCNLLPYITFLLVVSACVHIQLANPHQALASSVQDNGEARSFFIEQSSSSAPSSLNRSWYGTSASFSSAISLSSHYHDGNNVGIEVTSSCKVNGSFSAQLFREGTFIASATLKRNGFSKAEWLNVGPGIYNLRFGKANDGTTVHCSDIAFFSW